MENSIEFPQKIKNRTTIWSRNQTSGHIAEGSEIRILKRYLHSHVHCSIIHNSQDIETIFMSVNRWMNRDLVCVCIIFQYILEYYSAMKKKEILQFVTTWMDLEGSMLSETSQTEKNMCTASYHLYMKSKIKNQTHQNIE